MTLPQKMLCAAVWFAGAISAAAADGTAVLKLPIAQTNAADDLTQPLKVSPDGHFLTQPNGAPFFWLGDTAWDLFQRLDRDEVEHYLSDRAGKGFTIIQAVIGGAALHQGPNRFGQSPFVADDPTRPNVAYFDHVDWIIDRARHHGIRLAIIPYWGFAFAHGFELLNETHIQRGPRFDTASAEIYGRWLGQRYRGRGVTWILGGDVNPKWPKAVRFERKGDVYRVIFEKSEMTPVDWSPVYDAMAKGIAEGEGGEPLITYHPSCCSFPGTPKPATSLYFNDRTWLKMHMFQSSHYATAAHEGAGPQVGFDFGWTGPMNYEIVAHEYRARPPRPVIDGEPRYEDLGVDNDAPNVAVKGFWSGYDARNAAYHSVFAGAAGHTYGNHSVWQFYDPAHNKPDPPVRLDLPWQKAIERPTAGQLQYLKTLMLSRPYFARIPDQSLVVSDAGEGTAHIGATRDQSGDFAMVYLPHGQTVTVDLAKLSGAGLIGWWYDPRTGVAIRIKDDIPRAGTRSFTPPFSGKENDWILVLDNASKGFAAPGAEPGKEKQQ